MWNGQYARMLRWHAKLVAFRTGVPRRHWDSTGTADKVARVIADAAASSATHVSIDLELSPEEAREFGVALLDAFPSDEIYDTAQIFFQQCFHLKDWIRNDARAEVAAAAAAVEAFVRRSPELQLARDVCNGSKHLVLNRPPRPTPMIAANDFEGSDGRMVKVRIVIETPGEETDAFNLADSCVAQWRRFLSLHGL